MTSLYIFIILIFRVVQAVFSKKSSNHINHVYVVAKFTTVQMMISAALSVISVVIDRGNGGFSLLAFGLAALSGLTVFFCTAFGVYAMKKGSMAAQSMFANAGLLVPLMAGVFIFKQPISALQWLGVAMFFVSAYLLAVTDKKVNINFDYKVIFLWVASLLTNGGTMLSQQLFTAYCPGMSITVFTFVSFSIVALLGCVTVFCMRMRIPTEEGTSKMSKSLLVCAGMLATSVFVISLLATALTTLVPPVILFTVICGGATVITAIVGVIVYKEKLTVRNTLAIVIGIASLVIVKMF